MRQSLRSFGAPVNREQIHSKSLNTTFNVPTEGEYKTQVPEKFHLNDNILGWLYSRFQVERWNNVLMNDRPNQYSAYYHLGSNPLLQNALVLKAVRMLFGGNQTPNNVIDHHSGFNGVKTHENGIFLYKSHQSDYVLKWGYQDFMPVGLFSLWLVFPKYYMFLLPSLVHCLFVPRRWAVQKHFCWHAELLPHNEQVVFHKTQAFGQPRRFIVDIKNLQKVSSDTVTNKLIFSMDMFDPDMVFQDQLSQEIFVFDKQGVWNEECLNHPLLY